MKNVSLENSALECLISEIVDAVEVQAGDQIESPDFLGCMFPPEG
jgi:hypothetical protein